MAEFTVVPFVPDADTQYLIMYLDCAYNSFRGAFLKTAQPNGNYNVFLFRTNRYTLHWISRDPNDVVYAYTQGDGRVTSLTLTQYPYAPSVYIHTESQGIWDNAQSEILNIAEYPTVEDGVAAFIGWFPDPYNRDIGGETDTGGGQGDFDLNSDPINIPALPILSSVDTKFITLFNPSLTELQNLASYMWGSAFDMDAWKKIFADPMDAILGLSIVPVAVPNGGSKTVTVGNIPTGVTMTVAGSQYVAVDCGSVTLSEYWGAYLDYEPYTKVDIYLPFVGTHPLSTDDVMGKTLNVVYHVDILSGACCAYVKCGQSVLYSFVGQCSCSVPITGNDWTNVINGAITIGASIGSMVATGGATAPMAATTIATTAVNSLKPTVEKSGAMGGMGGMLGIQKPYLIITRPRQALPADQNAFMGYPSLITKQLSTVQGYTEVESIHLENVPATDSELSEIISLLKGGVIF